MKALDRAFVLALNEEYLDPTSSSSEGEEESLTLKPSDQLAVIPPISGG